MQSNHGASAPPNPTIVFENLQAFQRTAALRAAIELDVFRAIGQGAGDVASIARHVRASERGIRVLCDYLVIMGILQKVNGKYEHTASSAAFLDPSSPSCIASIANFIGNPTFREPYDHLAEIVRSGKTTLPGDGSVEPENPIWVIFARNMAPMMAPLAGALAKIVLDGRSGPLKVLDIAAGHGLFGIEVAKQNPQARVTGLDWAPVLQVALENARKAGVQDRYETLPGSAFDVNFGGPYDVVLLTNFLHHFDVETCVGIVKKVKGSLKAGGTAATLEFVPNEDRVSPPMAAGFSMTMLASTPAGDAYTFRELANMYERAGFKDVAAHPIPMTPQTVVTGRN
ncbi:MAG TPA: class I SAM-dependent methyltransferase [Candidatus Acidoferrales bacterium]|nr:class I SAM-dependent methyltransferase [Candidatus Acidoferrales bacterium]